MKKTFLTTLAVLFIAIGMNATTTNTYNNEQPFVFVESGIEFAVFKDGQFDFNVLNTNRDVNVRFNTRLIDFSFNTGHNYDAYVQHDEYGAVIQIENTPIFYDYYGRVNRIGNIHIDYNYNNLVSRIGNMRIGYNRYGEFRYSNGIINNYNVNYVYIPRYRTYRRPVATRTIVFHTPYRRNFTPRRCNYNTYRRNYKSNNRVTRNFRRPGNTVNRNNNRNAVSKRNTKYNKNRSDRRVVKNTRKANNTKNVRNNSRSTTKRSYANNNRTIKNTNKNNRTRNTSTKNTSTRTKRTTTKATTKRNNKKYAVKKYTKRTVASADTRKSRR